MRVALMLLLLCFLTGCASMMQAKEEPKPVPVVQQAPEPEAVKILRTLDDAGCDVSKFVQSKRSLTVECK